MRKIVLILFSLVFSSALFAQEIDCRIQLNYSRLPGTTYQQTFQTLQQQLYEFINNTVWTSHVYSRDERIECNIFITVEDAISADEFKGTIQIQSSRPVYNTSFMSPVFNHLDNDFEFRYTEHAPLEFNENSHQSNLTSVLAFYIYIILGFDYDTFGPMAGTEFFQKAERIVQNAQNAQERGWKAFENLTNRYWLVENLLNEQYAGMREFQYTYHRQGLDRIPEKPNEGRANVEQAIENFRNVHRRRPGSYLMQIITTAKRDEIINIFKEAFPDEKARIYNIMKEVDPANSSQYDEMMKEPEGF
jgi:hypothetical protein